MPKGGCDPVGSPCWSRLLAGPVACGERSPRWSRFAGRTCDPVGDPRWSSLFLKGCTPWKGPTLKQLVKNCSPWEGLKLEKLVEDCLLWEGPHVGAGDESEEEGAEETMCYELNATPIACPPVLLNGGEVEKIRTTGFSHSSGCNVDTLEAFEEQDLKKFIFGWYNSNRVR
ncbi:zinc finger and BTB domain-containing protein 5 [Grus japonensis]|uniref:Zinc finger and BTB domain-containing protein 5 n=1 Tax=Grus japonensis TaxID=30415 RepID=A0ABC9Y495_GRUJA